MHGLFDERRYLIPFRGTLLPQIFCDTLVIGGGVAGLRAAIEAAGGGSDPGAGGEVIVLSKSAWESTNTAWAQGGVAAVLGDGGGSGDTASAHAADTLEAGAGLCDLGVVESIVGAGGAAIGEMVGWGMRLDAGPDGRPAAGREGGHNAARIYHTDGDSTGREFQRVLSERAMATAGVRIFRDCFALDLITPSAEPGGPVLGAITHHPKHGLQMIWARTTILASGGAGQLYRETTNPRPATADGLAMAYRAGAWVADMAFVQFHPTTLYLPGANRALISEAVRGEGAVLLDASGLRFMPEVHPLADLAPRDVVSRAIVRQIVRQGGSHVWLDCRGVEGFGARFPGILATLGRFGLDPERDLIPVHPAAHYMVGGVRTDAEGFTGVANLYAVGEVAACGLHGANRLASNSLLEGLVMGARAGAAARRASVAGTGSGSGSGGSGAGGSGAGPTRIVSDIPPSGHGELDLHDVRSSLRSAMWRNIGIERTGTHLGDAGEMFDFWARYTLDKVFDEPAGWETQNMLLVGALVARSAAWRAESRGCHWRLDAPEASEAFRVHDLWRRGAGAPTLIGVDGAAEGGAHGSGPGPGGLAVSGAA